MKDTAFIPFEMQQSPNSAFVKPRKEHQRSRTAEKVSTDRFYGSRRNIGLSHKDDGIEKRESKQAEPNNNEVNSRVISTNLSNGNTRQPVEATGIPRRNFTKSAEPDFRPTSSHQPKDLQKRENDKNSPRPRRKLPSAPITSGPRPRTPKHNSEVSSRITPTCNEKPAAAEKAKNNSSVTPENIKKVPEKVLQNQVSNEKKSKILEDATNVNRKSSDPAEAAKSRSFTGGIKYNSLPRRRPSKTRSKFYLDIEGEETLPTKSILDLEENNGITEQIKGSTVTKKFSQENGSERSTNIFKTGKIFGGSTLKQANNESTLLSNGSNDKIEVKQTHIALYKFIPRHKDELVLEEGDPVSVVKFSDDLWCEGTNLANGKYGIFPSRYAADILSGSGAASVGNPEDQQFFLRFLGSVEVADYKGDEILCYAISKIVNQRAMLSSNTPPACTLQVTSRGIRVCDFDEKQSHSKSSPKFPKKSKGKEKEKQKETRDGQAVPTHFFSLKNVTFCGNHPRDRRYFGFITKHPDEHRFACHVFMSKYTTDPVAQAVGDCFKKFYTQYLDYRAPTEDIYME